MRLALIGLLFVLVACGADGPPTTPGPKQVPALVVIEGAAS
ncbi:argininosuccinate lyase [Donghicola tyrosinivorans]|uniref:Lipoprotein n=1 Tax=Donghicola tyrosinivorans TaxID=1652492 RepID=A0A2T0X007_9RHOB|nr:argininosuccinate lyase [Donghicola tyrosinivorans]PRY92286.1 hypothetical protein CLV74_102201 [Donghicola tyrosinivorans]